MKRLSLLFLVEASLAFAPFVQHASAQRIETVAGNGPDNIAAISANLVQPNGVAVDADNNVYVVSASQNRVFKVSSSGILTVLAGHGTYAYSGDNARAVDAELYTPQGIAADSSGNIYIADTVNERIRVVNTQTKPIKIANINIQPGHIATIAGSGAYEYTGDNIAATSAQLEYPNAVAVDAAGKVYIADTYNQRIRVVDTSGIITTLVGTGTPGYSGDGGPATQANLQFPNGVAVDAGGKIYIADTYNQRIRVVDPSGTIGTVAGTGRQGYSGDGGPAVQADLHNPVAIAVDGAGNLYIADMDNQRIRFVNTGAKPVIIANLTVQPGNIATVAGMGTQRYSGDGGPAAQAELHNPVAVAVDGAGNLYIADMDNQRIRFVNVGTKPVTSASVAVQPGNMATLAGNGTLSYGGDGDLAVGASLYNPEDIALGPGGSLYVGDLDNHRIRVVNTGGEPFTVANVAIQPGHIATVAGTGAPGYSGDGGPAAKAELYSPVSLASDSSGNLYFADLDNQRIRFLNAGTRPVTVANVTVSPDSIATIVGSGSQGYSGDGGSALKAELNNPSGVAVGDGSLYIADTDNQRIRLVNTGSKPITVAGVTVQPGSIATLAGTGTKGYTGDGGPAARAEFHFPIGLALDKSENLYIADTNSGVIRVINTSTMPVTVAGKTIQPATIATVAGTGPYDYEGNGLSASNDGVAATTAPIYDPVGVAVDASGNIYITDTYNQRIRVVNSEGIIDTLAGTGIYGNTADDIPAKSARLAYPYGIKVDGAGNVYFADSGNHRISKIVPAK